MRKKSWKNLTDKNLLEMLRNGESRVAIANRYGVSKYVLDERVKKAQMQMHIPPEDIHIGAAVGVLLPDIGPEVFSAKVEYIHPDGYFITVRRRPERGILGDPFACSNGYLTSVRPEQVVTLTKQTGFVEE